MSTKDRKSDPKFVRSYDRAMLRSAFVSLFWSIITERRKKGAYTLVQLAKALGANKAEVSRWFKGEPNWTLGTVANIANALDVDLKIEATDRKTKQIFRPAGLVHVLIPNRPQITSIRSPETPFKLTRAPGGASIKTSLVA